MSEIDKALKRLVDVTKERVASGQRTGETDEGETDDLPEPVTEERERTNVPLQ